MHQTPHPWALILMPGDTVAARWCRRGVVCLTMAEDADGVGVAALLAAGMTVREIAEEIGIGKSVVHRMKQRIDREAQEAAADQDE
jgi:hypothetical protein